MAQLVTKVQVGDVIFDWYNNPAVVLSTTNGKPNRVMQVVGSDRGKVVHAPQLITQVTDEARVAWAREIARVEWKRQNLRRADFPSN